jgi:hypothetical protein
MLYETREINLRPLKPSEVRQAMQRGKHSIGYELRFFLVVQRLLMPPIRGLLCLFEVLKKLPNVVYGVNEMSFSAMHAYSS